MLKKALKRGLIATLAQRNLFPTPRVPEDEVADLISSLRPVATASPLIRIGPDHDGGYLVPNDLVGVEACFSPGVEATSGFELDCAELGMEVFLADRSVDGPAEEHPNFDFQKKHLGAVGSHGSMTMSDWVARSVPASYSDLLLQIDIEGAEYETFLSMPDDLLSRFRIIVAEFHQLDMLLSRPFFGVAASTLAKILQTHACLHIHPNNNGELLRTGGLEVPSVAEFTFLRRDRIRNPVRAQSFPHPLDMDNNTFRPNMTLPDCWRG